VRKEVVDDAERLARQRALLERALDVASQLVFHGHAVRASGDGKSEEDKQRARGHGATIRLTRGGKD
jgi:hypothetical protein